jgi:MT-A70
MRSFRSMASLPRRSAHWKLLHPSFCLSLPFVQLPAIARAARSSWNCSKGWRLFQWSPRTEHCLMAVRGKPTVTLTNQTTVLHAPARAHSQKPDAFYDMVEALCPAPRYAYLFARTGFFAILAGWSRAELSAPANEPIASGNKEADHDR